MISGSGAALAVSWDRNANGYRLPTEAEWEYACRAGTTTPFSTGGNITVSQANYHGQNPYNNAPGGEYRERTMPVGSFAPNAWGLHDMHGNVWEWCWDRYGGYPDENGTDPAGPSEGNFRVNRGGGWNDFGQHLRSAYRAVHPPGNKTFNLGFRVARNGR
jgi:formylglycine-generating enzyme required for sulfatase activity